MYETELLFDYQKEPARDILCIDCKSFYASVECVERNLDPLKTELVVMSYPSNDPKERGSGLILASSPQAKKRYGISNVSRARNLPYPYPESLIIAPPQMRLYMEKNMEVNAIYKSFVAEEDHHVYSVDESFLDITDSLKYFNCQTAYELAQKIRAKTRLYTTIGIGDNPLLAKLALDNAAKHEKNMIAEWRYQDVPQKVWRITPITDFWGISRKTAKRLAYLNIHSIEDLAQANYYQLKARLGLIGAQLYAHAWGIDRSFLGADYKPKEKSLGNSQVLPKDYTRRKEIEVVIKEMADQVATRLRRNGAKAQSIGLQIGYSLGYLDRQGKTGFHQQLKIPATNSSQTLAAYLLQLFAKYYCGQDIRTIGVNCQKLIYTTATQLDLFCEPERQLKTEKIDQVVDSIRQKYGFKSLVHAHSLLPGARAIDRSSLVGGHAGGMAGIEGTPHEKNR